MDPRLPLTRLLEAGRAPWQKGPDGCTAALGPVRQAVGVLCSYVPGEMIHAAGFVPVRLRGTDAPLRRVDAHLQSFTCALCRSTLDQFLGGELSSLAGVVFAHSCDAMQALADVWRMSAPPGFHLEVVMQPARVGDGSPAARTYLEAELDRFRHRLAGWTGRPVSDDDLRASIALYDETRRLVQALQQRRDRLTASEFLDVLDCAQAAPREWVNPLLAELLAALEAVPPRPAGARLFLSGAVLDQRHVPELIEEAGGRVVGDDLCSASRHFYGQVGVDGDPLRVLADYSLRRPPCPAKYCAGYESGRALLDQVRQARADGVVFVLEKYCDPHAFERALVLPALDRAGIPHLLLELEQTASVEALRTRVQAFVEMF